MTQYDYRGAIHCHSTYSDGGGGIEEVMNAANEAGLDFVLMTDSNTMKVRDDGHERWHGSTLLIAGTEIAPAGSHYIAFGEGALQNVERLKDLKPQEMIDEVARQGWFGFIAHPDHGGTQRFGIPSCRWEDWNVTGYTGFGLWDLMTDFQAQLDREDLSLETFNDFATTLTGPRSDTLARWDELCRRQKVVGIGEIDNHAYEKEFQDQKLIIFPYETAFRTVTNHVLLEKPLDKDPEKAKKQVLDAVRWGHLYISFDYWDDPTEFSFEVDNGKASAGMGEEIALGAEKTELAVTLPEEALINVFQNGESIHEEENNEVLLEISQPGVYRIETMRDNLTWILSNPIWVKK
ncbi:MAG: CehA/McbA family metallohydrolase [Planctomycetes bacterium]|nr:CehA/McbA family metallohydrolase [Planctomycetota bacterium]